MLISACAIPAGSLPAFAGDLQSEGLVLDRSRDFARKGRTAIMDYRRSLPLFFVAGALLTASALSAQNPTPDVQIVSQIDNSQLVTLKGNTYPAAIAKNDSGPVSPDLPMTDLLLVLRRTPRQQVAFDAFVASQYDSSSPNYHRWLEPVEVGQTFGPALSDIDLISNWLRGQGFSVGEVSNDRMSIRFSGTAGLVESAFHTKIHNLVLNGVPHIGNMTDPQIPAALAPAVVGVKAMHNFFPHPLHRVGSQVKRNSQTGGWQRIGVNGATGLGLPGAAGTRTARPEYGIVTGAGVHSDLFEEVAPYDFATIYNLLPLWQAATPIDGTGQTIAIVGTSSINLSDVDSFRSIFGLPAYTAANAPAIVSGNGSTLQICTSSSATAVCGINDLIENTLDVEWAGAVATGAKIVLVSSASKSATDDTVLDSASYIVQNKTAPIMNMSYGLCELAMGTAYNATYNNLWQTAASEGIAVFVATGDQGSAACDLGDQTTLTLAVAENGLMVSGLASTPYNTAVGGTDFNWCKPTATSNCTNPAPYWGATNNAATGATALGYVPEVPWNDTCASPQSVAYLATIAQYIGYATPVTSPEEACNFVVNKYTYIYTNLGHADISGFVNVVGGSGGASNCSTNTSVVTPTTVTFGTCTSGYAKPSWQSGVPGIPADGMRDIPDVSFFAADGLWNSSYLICASATGNACTGANTPTEVGGTSVSSPAMAGVMALINQKAGSAQGNPNQELYALAAKQTYSSCSAASVNNSSTCYFNDVDTSTVAMPCDNGLFFPGLSPDCPVSTAGDTVGILSGVSAGVGYDMATGLGSLNVANVVNNWTAAIGSASANVTVVPASSSLLVNAALSVTVTVASASGSGATPTGTVILSGGGYTSAPGTLSNGSYTFSIPASSLAIGSDTLTVIYSGDSTYASITNNATTVQVTGLTPAIAVTPSAATLYSNAPLSVTVTVTGVSGSPTPTGTVTLSSGTYSSGAQALSAGSYTFTIPAYSLAAGSNTLAVTYSGDSVYAAASNNTVSVSVTLSAFALSAASSSLTLTPGATTGNTSTISVTPAGGFTGAVNLTCAVTTSLPSPTSPATCAISTPVSITGSTAATATLAVSTTATTTPGAYLVTVTGADAATGKITSSTPVSVTVGGPQSYALSNSGPVNIAAGAATGNTSTISVTPSGGFIGTVSLGCSVATSIASPASPATCTIPSSVSVTGSAAVTATLTVATTSTTSAGTYTVTVTGTSGSISQTTGVSVTVTAATGSGGDYTLSATTPAAVTRGAAASSTVTVSSTNGYAGTVTVACALTSSPTSALDLPTCSASISTVNLTTSTTSGTVTFNVGTTAAPTAALEKPAFGGGRGWAGGGAGVVMALLVFFGIPRRRRNWRSMLGILAVLVALGGLSGCSNFWANPYDTGTTSGAYTFTVTGTGSPAVTPAPTATFTLTVN